MAISAPAAGDSVSGTGCIDNAANFTCKMP
jgi:hypothetical protein